MKNSKQLFCPACRCEWVHFEPPTFTASDNYEAWEGRGNAITVPMWCEEGHSWTMVVGFHKGTSWVQCINPRLTHPPVSELEYCEAMDD